MQTKEKEIIKKIIEKNPKLILANCEDEYWSGECIIYFKNGIPSELSKCDNIVGYLGKDSIYLRCGSEELELDYEEIEYWTLPLDYYEMVDLFEALTEQE